MLTREVFVQGRSVYANGDTSLIRTSQGVYDMHVLFDAAEWLDFPVRVVFGYGSSQVSQTLTLESVESDEWAAEASMEIPWEVMAELGTVRLTFQGSSNNDHIITAQSGYTLWSVIQEGDIPDGTVPTPAPSIDEWEQAYADAMAAANAANSAAGTAAEAADEANEQAERAEAAAEAAEQVLEDGIPLMDAQTRGGAKAGAGVEVDATEHLNLTPATASAIGGVTVDDSTIEATAGELSIKAVPADKLTGTISAGNLPSYVDDVEEYASASDFPATGETGKIYVALDSNASYRWGGSAYIRVASGENATTTTDGLMSHTDKAKLDAAPGSYGDGLSLSSDVLSLGPLTKRDSGAIVETDGCAIFNIDGEGWSEQDTTTGKNLAIPYDSATESNGVIVTPMPDGSVLLNGTATGTYVNLTKNTATLAAGNAYTASIGNYTGTGITDYGISGYGTSKTVTPSSDFNGAGVQAITTVGTVFSNVRLYPQLEAGSQPTAYEPYSGGKPAPSPDFPQPIRVCRGRNLLQMPSYSEVFSAPVVGSYHCYPIQLEPYEEYYLSVSRTDGGNGKEGGHILVAESTGNTNWKAIAHETSGYTQGVLTAPADGNLYLNVSTSTNETQYNNAVSNSLIQLNTGSTPMPYVPYGHIGIDITLNGQTTTTPVPLPSKGWAGAAGDYADALSIDSAGGYRWDVETMEKVFDGSESWAAISGYDGLYRIDNIVPEIATPTMARNRLSSHFIDMGGSATGLMTGQFAVYTVSGGTVKRLAIQHSASTLSAWKAWLAANNTTFLYPLAAPIVETGRIVMPDLPLGATVSIPELESIGVSWFVAGAEAAVEHGNNVLRRAQAENEEIENAIADLATRVAALEA